MDGRLLAEIPLFAGLDPSELAQVARWADDVDVPAGRTLATEGEFGYEFFVILDGTAEVRRGATVLRSLGEGDFFGELALLATDARTASVVATSPLRLVVIAGAQFRQLDAALPEVAERLRRAVGERLGR